MAKGKYASTETRFFTFDQFLGIAKINESVPKLDCQHSDGNTDLRSKFKSGLPIVQQPTAFGLKFAYRPIMGRKIL